MLAHKIERRIVESKEAVLICDKCGYNWKNITATKLKFNFKPCRCKGEPHI